MMLKKLLTVLFTFCATTISAQNHTANLVEARKIKEVERNVVLLNNAKSFIPLINIKNLKIASVHFNFTENAVFDSIVNKYHAVTGFNADTIQHFEGFNKLHDKLKLFNTVIITLSEKTKFDTKLQGFIQDLETGTNVIVVLAGEGKNLSFLDKIKAPIIWYKNTGIKGALNFLLSFN